MNNNNVRRTATNHVIEYHAAQFFKSAGMNLVSAKRVFELRKLVSANSRGARIYKDVLKKIQHNRANPRRAAQNKHLLRQTRSNLVKSRPQAAALLQEAVVRGYSAHVGGLLKAGGNPNQDTFEVCGQSLLTTAMCYMGDRSHHLAVITLLLKFGADPDGRRQEPYPLITACAKQYTRVVQLLLKYGANPNVAVGRKGITPLYSAVTQRNVQIVRMLLEAKADPRVIIDGVSLLMISRHLSISALLLQYGADVHARYEGTGKTLLMGYVTGSGAMVDLLLKYGARVNDTDDHGATAVAYAAQKDDNLPIIRRLLLHGADPNIFKENKFNRLGQLGGSAFYRAARRGDLECVKLLLRFGFDVRKKGTDGKSALTWAASHPQSNIATLIMTVGKKNEMVHNVKRRRFH